MTHMLPLSGTQRPLCVRQFTRCWSYSGQRSHPHFLMKFTFYGRGETKVNNHKNKCLEEGSVDTVDGMLLQVGVRKAEVEQVGA